MVIKISYILGIYNAERTLKECLDSILMQNIDKKYYEILIMDGGSTDKTLEIIKSYMKKEKNIKLFHNLKKLSEGKGNGKDQGVSKAKGKYLVFLDHDNILLNKDWINQMLMPFKDKEVMASQSLLGYKQSDTNFLKYINALGVEDPFAVPYSLVSQVILNPNKFKQTNNYFIFNLSKKNILFFGANGCIFRKSVFKIINGYTRDVDVSATMAEHNMKVAIPKISRLHHKTSNNMFSFLKKKTIYFYRFINKEYETKSFKWTQLGSPPSTIRFFLTVLTNLTLIVPLFQILPKFAQDKKLFWLLHPFYVFYITLLYGFVTLIKFRNFLKYV